MSRNAARTGCGRDIPSGAQDAAARFVPNTSTVVLAHDAAGSGARSAVTLATFAGGIPVLTTADVVVSARGCDSTRRHQDTKTCPHLSGRPFGAFAVFVPSCLRVQSAAPS